MRVDEGRGRGGRWSESLTFTLALAFREASRWFVGCNSRVLCSDGDDGSNVLARAERLANVVVAIDLADVGAVTDEDGDNDDNADDDMVI